MNYCIGVDVGGTFTDAVLLNGTEIWTAKSPTTANFVDGVMTACELAAQRAGSSLGQVYHGSHASGSEPPR